MAPVKPDRVRLRASPEDHMQQMAGGVFAALRDGVLKSGVLDRCPLAAAAEAHRDVEAWRTSGQIVLLPWSGSVFA